MSLINHANTSEANIWTSLCKLDQWSESEPIHLHVDDGQKKTERLVLNFLGSGGSKRAYQLEDGTALLMPNITTLDMAASSHLPVRLFDEEIKATNFVSDLGLLVCHLETVTVFMGKNSTLGIPAYLTPTFEKLAKDRIWVIDRKNPFSSTWNRSFFATPSDALDEKKWAQVLHPLWLDLAKLLWSGIHLDYDNLNLAVMENHESDPSIPYVLRYFGFDFSNKYASLSIKEARSFQEIKKMLDSTLREMVFDLLTNELTHSTESMPVPITKSKIFTHLEKDGEKKILTEVIRLKMASRRQKQASALSRGMPVLIRFERHPDSTVDLPRDTSEMIGNVLLKGFHWAFGSAVIAQNIGSNSIFFVKNAPLGILRWSLSALIVFSAPLSGLFFVLGAAFMRFSESHSLLRKKISDADFQLYTDVVA